VCIPVQASIDTIVPSVKHNIKKEEGEDDGGCADEGVGCFCCGGGVSSSRWWEVEPSFASLLLFSDDNVDVLTLVVIIVVSIKIQKHRKNSGCIFVVHIRQVGISLNMK
jgi:hypothetical protein